jgi:hypothetical protein
MYLASEIDFRKVDRQLDSDGIIAMNKRSSISIPGLTDDRKDSERQKLQCRHGGKGAVERRGAAMQSASAWGKKRAERNDFLVGFFYDGRK